MKNLKVVAMVLFCFGVLTSLTIANENLAPEHYYNDPENLHEDPDHTPGDYALGDTYAAQTVYESLKNNLIEPEDLLSASDTWVTLGLGEISFKSSKNETAEVLGYFKEYRGVLKRSEEGLEMAMAIDINSLDTAVPGRNNRILDIFFNSTQANLGAATVTFNQFDFGNLAFEDLKNGIEHEISVTGTLSLNGVTKPIVSQLSILYQNSTWLVKTKEPLVISIANFSFGDRIYELMKVCNHKSLGDKVKVEVELYLK